MNNNNRKGAFKRISIKPQCPRLGSLLGQSRNNPDRKFETEPRASVDQLPQTIDPIRDSVPLQSVAVNFFPSLKQKSFKMNPSELLNSQNLRQSMILGRSFRQPLDKSSIQQPIYGAFKKLQRSPEDTSKLTFLSRPQQSISSFRTKQEFRQEPKTDSKNDSKQDSLTASRDQADNSRSRNILEYAPIDRFLPTKSNRESGAQSSLKQFIDRKLKTTSHKDQCYKFPQTSSYKNLVFTKKKQEPELKPEPTQNVPDDPDLAIAPVFTFTYQSKLEPSGDQIKAAYQLAIKNTLGELKRRGRTKKLKQNNFFDDDKLQIANLFFLSSESNHSGKSCLKVGGAKSCSEKHVSFDESSNQEHVIECEFAGVSASSKTRSSKGRSYQKLDFSLPLIYDQFSLKNDW